MTHSHEVALVVFVVIFLLVVLLPFIFNGFLAKSRGKNVFLMLLLSLFFSWLLTLILALMPVDKKNRERYGKSNFKTILPFACIFIISTAFILLWDEKPDFTDITKQKINNKTSSLTAVPSIENEKLRGHKSNDLKFGNNDVRKALEDTRAKRNESQDKKEKHRTPDFQYEILLFSGGKIYTNNAVIEEKYVRYKGNGGLVIALNRNEIKSMKRVKL